MSEMSQDSSWTQHISVTVLTPLNNHYQKIVNQVKDYIKETVEHLLLFSICYTITCILLYFAITHWKLLKFRNDVKNPKRILLVIAHPDDECMFFGPSVINFTRQKGCIIYLMCLSSGKNYGMEKKRRQELYKSCRVLGIEDERIVVHNHTNLPDKIDVKWPIELVASLILNHIETYDIDTFITFDKHGVSTHPNHSSIYYAVAHLCIEKKLPKGCTVYVLESVNILRKYWLLLDIPLSFLLSRTRFLVSFGDRRIIHKAMKQHQSQLVWFRRLYMLFSRYMLINTFQKMDLSDIELDLAIDD